MECFISFNILNCIDTIIPLKVTTATPILGRFPSMIDRVKWWVYLTDHTHQHPSESSPQSFRLREQNGHGVIATWRCACVIVRNININFSSKCHLFWKQKPAIYVL